MSLIDQIASSTTINTTAEPTAKRAAPPVTRRSVQFRIDAAEKRLAGYADSIQKDTELLAELRALYETLPEQAPAAVRVVCKLDDSVKVKQGRGATASIESGVVVGVKLDENGKPERYKVEIGEGFDAVRVNVFPGQVVEVNGAAQESDEDNAEDTDGLPE